MTLFVSLICIIFSAFLPQNPLSQAPVDTSDQQLGVQEALNIALENSPALNRIKEQLNAQKGKRRASWMIDDPEVYYMREGMKNSQFTEQRWAISQSMDFPLASYYQLQSSDKQVKALETRLEAEKLQLKAEVKRTYTDLAYSIEIFHLSNEQVNLAQKLKDAASTRFEVGESSQIDVVQSEVQLAEAQNDLNDAQRRIQNARYTLFNVIGLDPDQQRYELEFPDTLAYFEYNIQQEQVLSKLPDHPEARFMNKQVDAARYQIKATKTRYLPSLRIDYYKQELPSFSSNYDFTGFEVGFTIPLWFAINQSGEVQTAKAHYHDMQWAYKETSLRLKKQAEQAWHSYQSSRSTIQRYHDNIRTKSRNLLDLTQEGYSVGEMDLLTLLEAQRTYLDSQRRYYQALRDYYHQMIELERYLQINIVFNQPVQP